MLDLAFVRRNPTLVKETVRSRKAPVDVDELLACDEQVRALQAALDSQRHELKSRSQSKPSPDQRAALQTLSGEIKAGEHDLAVQEARRNALTRALPNLNDPDTPVGASEADNVVVHTVGKKPSFDFEPLPYFKLPCVAPHLKMDAGVRTSGSRFYFLTGLLAQLQHAVFSVVNNIVASHGFERVSVPVLVRERAMFGTGHFPADRNEIYTVNPGEDDLFLVGTAEVPLMSLHDGELVNAAALPRRYSAETTCFRREAGSYGKDQQGILRVHQFQKIEMVVLCAPEQSRQLHREILAIEEEIAQAFDLHYRVVNICTADLGYPAAQKFDVEAWFPAEGRYRELTSTSNTTDFQTRRLHIRCSTPDGAVLAHSVNGTGATDRLWLAILEQHQQEDGTVLLPKILKKQLGVKRLV